MDCNNTFCPYITGSDVDFFMFAKPSGEKCEHFDSDEGVPNCSECGYFVNVGGYRTYCRLSRCIDSD